MKIEQQQPGAPRPHLAAQGDHRVQLAHLKHNLAFQRQDRCNLMTIDWKTTITRAQSRRDITRDLHDKINSKVPGFHPPGKMNTPDGQAQLASIVSHARGGNHHGGHAYVHLPWNLRYRIYKATMPRVYDTAFWELTLERSSPPIRHKRDELSQEWRYRLYLREKTEELIRAQGANPRHHKRAIIMLVHPCQPAGAYITQDQADQDGKCPHCTVPLDSFTLREAAFDPGDQPAHIAPGTWRQNRSSRQTTDTHTGTAALNSPAPQEQQYLQIAV